MPSAAKLYLTQEDYEVLESVADRYARSVQIDFLENELARAEVVSTEEIPDNVVTLHPRARVVDESTGIEKELTLMPPGELSNTTNGQVSVLSPLGAVIIGLTEGQTLTWPMASGQSRRFRVKKLLFQPQAAQKLRAKVSSGP